MAIPASFRELNLSSIVDILLKPGENNKCPSRMPNRSESVLEVRMRAKELKSRAVGLKKSWQANSVVWTMFGDFRCNLSSREFIVHSLSNHCSAYLYSHSRFESEKLVTRILKLELEPRS